ncbi:MAG: PEP-CTERM sorting domain-containing protein [Gammaproteobacteria bacterium]|nr:PEP-CTERM sorting domain-containing protein [Gammaproteobacteria bacterium]
MTPFNLDIISFNDIAPVPVPSAVWLFVLGLLGLLTYMRRAPSAS